MAYTRGSNTVHTRYTRKGTPRSNGDELSEALHKCYTPGRSRPGYSGLGLGLVVVVAAVFGRDRLIHISHLLNFYTCRLNKLCRLLLYRVARTTYTTLQTEHVQGAFWQGRDERIAARDVRGGLELPPPVRGRHAWAVCAQLHRGHR